MKIERDDHSVCPEAPLPLILRRVNAQKATEAADRESFRRAVIEAAKTHQLNSLFSPPGLVTLLRGRQQK